MGGGPLGIAYGLRVPHQALVPTPRVGLNHADPEDRSGRAVYPSWGVPAVTAVFPAQRQSPHHVFCVRFGLQKVGTQNEVENSIYSLDSDSFLLKLNLQAVNTSPNLTNLTQNTAVTAGTPQE